MAFDYKIYHVSFYFFRVDSDATFMIKVNYGGYFEETKKDKKYVLGRQRINYVDIDYYNFTRLCNDLSKMFKWEADQALCIWYVGESKSFISITSDAQFMSICSMHSDVKVLELFVTIKSNSIQISSDSLGTGGNEFGQRYSSANLRVQTDEQPLYRDDKSVDDQGEKEFRDEEILNIADQAEENRDQATKNTDGANGIDIDDSNVVWSENSFHSRYSSDSEEEVVDYLDVYKVDKENPVMEVGSMFANKETLKTVLSQYALLHEFEVKVEKSDKKRLNVVCAAESCKWSLHASVLQDGVTFQVLIKTIFCILLSILLVGINNYFCHLTKIGNTMV